MSVASIILGILLLIFLFPPVVIARLANFAGRYRLVLMIVLLVIFWSIIMSIVTYFAIFPGDVVFMALMAMNQAATIVVVLPLVLISRIFVRIIARRYAPSVVDAIATVIIGSTTSFLTPIFGVYLFINTVDYPNKFADTHTSLPPGVAATIFLLLAILTSLSAWILIGWGSMSTLRRRKGTVLGLVSVSMALLFSVVLAMAITEVSGIIFSINSISTVADRYKVILGLIAGGAISIIVGMLAAGFMSGILVGIASIFDLMAFFVTVVLILVSIINTFRVYNPPFSSSQTLALIIVLSIIQLRCFLIGNKVVSLLSLAFLSLPFIGLAMQSYSNRLPTGIVFAPMFIVVTLLLAQWGVALRSTRYGGLITTILLVAALIATPFIYASL